MPRTFCSFLLFWTIFGAVHAEDVHIRLNLLGYLPEDAKIGMAFSKNAVQGTFQVFSVETGQVMFQAPVKAASPNTWGGQFSYYYTLDFSALETNGRYFVSIGPTQSAEFQIGQGAYRTYQEDLLAFMRQQRCGYNPYLDMVCHKRDGRVFYAPVPDSSFYDLSGGWHDAGDQLKYLITGSNATARMLLAYELQKDKFADEMDDLGHPVPNGIPDVLDEAKWGLDWIHKLHPKPNWLFHQVADDRDHRGFKLPDADNADYGWGANSYRVGYFADGKPQGLGKWKSESTGIANIAGRSAAAMAMAARIWRAQGLDSTFALKCLKAAIELYDMGKAQEGFQQGNSYGAPYRYNEDSWADDMEWGAAELYRLTQDRNYLDDAKHYANLIQDDGILARDTMAHYQKYPFMNMGHFALYQVADVATKAKLAGWYKQNIEHILARSQSNTFQIGTPFIWCSANIMVNFVTQVLLYENMTGDKRYHTLMLLHRDWLFGRNPWGSTMFSGIPYGGESPDDVHLPVRNILQKTPIGGLADGPIYASIYQKLLGLNLHDPDEFADFQTNFVVYHDDIGDYSTNEPTMDGTADAIFMMAYFGSRAK
jgi:hypothetical protein